MRNKDSFLLLILRSCLLEQACEEIQIDKNEWEALLYLSDEQDILPLIFDSCVNLPSMKALDREKRKEWQEKALRIAIRQIVQTNEFLTLVLHAQAQGLNPVVLKGIVCRSLYPKPMLRPSVDEDLLIPPEETERWHSFFLSEGLSIDEPDMDRTAAAEISYHRQNSPTYIELHKSLFPPNSNAYGDLNQLFDGVLDRTVEVQIEDVKLRTLAPTDHLLYLICHAYKHFLHGGVGIRQIADMALFSNAYGGDIDWEHIYRACRSVNIETFTAALLRIAHKYLTMNTIPDAFTGIEVDEQPLLEDILSGGLYGTVYIDRVHSGNMTLDAVAAQKQGRRGSGVWHSLFPGAAYLQGHFPYVKKHPILLPLAWAQRLGNYLARSSKSNLAETIRIGQARIDLLKQYKVI